MKDPRLQFGPTAEKYLHSAVHSNEAALRRLVEVAKPSGGVLLDVATGAGHVAHTFSPYVDRVIASDITPEMLNVAMRVAADRGMSNVSACLSAAEHIPFQNDSLDAVTCRVAPHHFRDVPQFLAETKRALKRGGWLLLADTVGVESDDEADDELDRIEFLRDPSHVRNYRPSVWREMLNVANLKIEFGETVPKPLNAIDWLERMNVPESTQETVLAKISGATGWLKEYLRPHGTGDLLTFHLQESLFLCRA